MNNENQNPISLEEKYQLYKTKQQNKKQISQNLSKGEVSIKPLNQMVQFVKSESNSENVMHMLLGDPTLK